MACGPGWTRAAPSAALSEGHPRLTATERTRKWPRRAVSPDNTALWITLRSTGCVRKGPHDHFGLSAGRSGCRVVRRRGVEGQGSRPGPRRRRQGAGCRERKPRGPPRRGGRARRVARRAHRHRLRPGRAGRDRIPGRGMDRGRDPRRGPALSPGVVRGAGAGSAARCPAGPRRGPPRRHRPRRHQPGEHHAGRRGHDEADRLRVGRRRRIRYPRRVGDVRVRRTRAANRRFGYHTQRRVLGSCGPGGAGRRSRFRLARPRVPAGRIGDRPADRPRSAGGAGQGGEYRPGVPLRRCRCIPRCSRRRRTEFAGGRLVAGRWAGRHRRRDDRGDAVRGGRRRCRRRAGGLGGGTAGDADGPSVRFGSRCPRGDVGVGAALRALDRRA